MLCAFQVDDGTQGVVRFQHAHEEPRGRVPSDDETAGGPVVHLHHVLLLIAAAGGHQQLAADGDVRAVVTAEVDAGAIAVLLPTLPDHHVIVTGPHGQLRLVLVAGHVLVHAELAGNGVPVLCAGERGQQGEEEEDAAHGFHPAMRGVGCCVQDRVSFRMAVGRGAGGVVH